MSRRTWLVVAALVVGVGVPSCLVTTDLDGLDAGSGGAGGEPSGGGGVGAGTGGGANGGNAAGGAGATGGTTAVAPLDWASSMTAVYLFEVTDLGRDSSGNGLDLVPSFGTASQSADDPPQGDFALRILLDGKLEGVHDELDPSDNPSLTFGGWVRLDQFDISAELIDNGDVNVGYFARLVPAQSSLECGAGAGAVKSSADSVVAGAWTHAVCRFDSAASTVEAIIDGTVTGISPTSALMQAGPGEFSLGKNMDGELDEVFITKQALSDAAVRRIYACGLDGAKCACDQNDPTKYENCGRRHPDCEGPLPPCDQSSP